VDCPHNAISPETHAIVQYLEIGFYYQPVKHCTGVCNGDAMVQWYQAGIARSIARLHDHCKGGCNGYCIENKEGFRDIAPLLAIRGHYCVHALRKSTQVVS
jgi:hypothetical protein